MIEEYRRGIPTYKGENGQTVGLLCETKEQCITDDDGVMLRDKLAGLKKYTDDAYANSNLYTDTKIGELINGAPTTLDTLKEIADAMEDNADVVEALDKAVGSKVDQAEYDGHANNETIHVTAAEKEAWSKNGGEEIQNIISGTTTVGNANKLGGKGAGEYALQNAVDNIQTTSRANLSQPGWYRVAKIDNDWANSCQLSFGSIYMNNLPEVHEIRFDNSRDNPRISGISHNSVSVIKVFTKVRKTYDGAKYLEVYYALSTTNTCTFTVLSGIGFGSYWQAITPTLTSETADGVTVTATYDIPANATPATSADLANYLPLSGGTLNGILKQVTDGSYTSYRMATSAKKYDVEFMINDNSGCGLFDNIHNKWILQTISDGTNTFNGTATGNVPLAGNVNLDGWLQFMGGLVGVAGDGNHATLSSNDSAGDSNNNRRLLVMNHAGSPSVQTALKLRDMIDGGITDYTVVHSGNVGEYALPKSGGTVNGMTAFYHTDVVPLAVRNTNGGTAYISYQSSGNGLMGMLGFDGVNSPVFYKGDWTAKYTLHHDGNSAKCVVVDTDPGVGASVSYADGTLIFVKE